MIININPNRINTAGSATRTGVDRRRSQTGGESNIPTPKRAHVNIVPSPESLSTMIRGAVAALRKGVRWDRGTMVNLLV
jgi:hypothetical protein